MCMRGTRKRKKKKWLFNQECKLLDKHPLPMIRDIFMGKEVSLTRPMILIALEISLHSIRVTNIDIMPQRFRVSKL